MNSEALRISSRGLILARPLRPAAGAGQGRESVRPTPEVDLTTDTPNVAPGERERALGQVVDGQPVPGTGRRDGRRISDIKLFCQTNGFSGN